MTHLHPEYSKVYLDEILTTDDLKTDPNTGKPLPSDMFSPGSLLSIDPDKEEALIKVLESLVDPSTEAESTETMWQRATKCFPEGMSVREFGYFMFQMGYHGGKFHGQMNSLADTFNEVISHAVKVAAKNGIELFPPLPDDEDDLDDDSDELPKLG